MKCPYCGKANPLESVYCIFCGKKLLIKEKVTQKIKTDNTSRVAAAQQKIVGERVSGCRGARHLFFMMLIIFLFAVALLGFVKCVQFATKNDGQTTTGGSTAPFTRAANNNDITMEVNTDLASLGSKFTVSPQVDIKGLQVTVEFLDKNKNKLTETEKYLGNVQKGVQVSFTVSLSDLGLSVTWNAHYTNTRVSGGTVSYFA